MWLRQLTFVPVPFLILTSCGVHGERQDILQCASPDKTWVAMFYREFGGGAAGWQYEYVSVRRIKGGKEIIVLQMSHGHDVVLTWLSPMELQITYPDSARIDHWQSHFEQKLDGTTLLNWTTVLKPLKSKEGSFIAERTRCGN